MVNVKLLLLLFLIPFQSIHALDVISKWVFPSRVLHPSDRGPQERTRPVIIGDILYMANLDGYVYAFHRTEGYTLWKAKMPAGVEGALAFARSKVFVGDTAGNLTAFHSRNGEVAWTFKGQAEWLSAPVVLGNRVFAVSSNDEVFGLDEVSGKVIWHFPHRGDEKMTIRGTTSPAVKDGYVYQGFSDGFVVALNSESGKPLWQRQLKTTLRFYDIDTAPLYVDDQNLIVGTYDGKVHKLDRMTGNTKWSFPVGSYSGFLVEEKRVYFSGLDGNVYALNLDLGDAIWKTSFGKGVGLTPARIGEHLVVTTSSDPTLVLDPRDGKVVWKTSLGTGTLTAAVGDTEGWFYCMSNYGNLYSFEILKERKIFAEPQTVATPSALHRNRVPIIERNPAST
jgi:outer membrane protein assembly factor BamB